MDTSEFTERMEVIAANRHDPESTHSEADSLMVLMFRQLGYDAAMDAYDEVRKWYS